MWSLPDTAGRRIAGVLAMAAALLSAAACDSKAPAPAPVIGSYVTGIQVLGDAGARQERSDRLLEAGRPDGPQARIAASATVVAGGSIPQTVTSDTPFRVVRVAVEPITQAPATGATPAPAVTSTGAPGGGYHEITLSRDVTQAKLALTVSPDLPSQRFVLYVAVVDAGGTQGGFATQDVVALPMEPGAVVVTLSWDADSDVDLRVVDPSGEQVSYASPTSTSGGRLRLDSNTDCYIDGVRNETVTWAVAPPGTYTVLVDLYRSCGVPSTDYVVTVRVAGAPARIFPGTLAGDGGSGPVAVATFDVPVA